jgi:TPR repeat protein
MQPLPSAWRWVSFGGLTVCWACASQAPESSPTAAASVSAAAGAPTTSVPEDANPPLLIDTRTPSSPAETDPIVATMEPLPPKYACATLSARGRKLRKLPQRTADAYAECQTELSGPGTGDARLRSCLKLTKLLVSAPRDEVLSDNVAARACARGSQRACRKLAESRLGSGARFDPICAEQLLEDLCAEGELGSCFRLGTLKLEGELVVEDAAAGRALIERACDRGEYTACLDIVMREKLSDAEKQKLVAGAFEAATKACAADDADACLELGSAYAHAGQWYYLVTPEENEAKQLELRQRACGLGSHDACGWLERGQRTDVYKDRCDEESEACAPAPGAKGKPEYEEWLVRRCAAGWDSACEEHKIVSRRSKPMPTPDQLEERRAVLESGCLGGTAGACAILSQAAVVPNPPSEKILQAGCDLGLAGSCQKLAMVAESAGDAATRLQYLERACPVVTPQGRASVSRSACRVAGIMYKDGAGVSQDLERAAILLQKGCVERRYVLDGEACVALGTMYEAGTGVQKSLSRALDLYAAGCADEGYMGQVRSRARSRAARRGGPEAPPSPPPKEPTACTRLRKWVRPPKGDTWGQ